MRLLLTNDDGFDAPGLAALYRAIPPGSVVAVVAPSGERSACGHSATLGGPIRVVRRNHAKFGAGYAVDGSPADCVRLAVSALPVGPFDGVLSGINRGANVSVVDAASSGTVAGAREGAFCGLRAIALSQKFNPARETDWAMASRLAAELIPRLLSEPFSPGVFWNVNFPSLPADQCPAGLCVVPLSGAQIPLQFKDDGGEWDAGRVFTYTGYYNARTITPGTDVEAAFGDRIAVTPLRVDATDPVILGADVALLARRLGSPPEAPRPR